MWKVVSKFLNEEVISRHELIHLDPSTILEVEFHILNSSQAVEPDAVNLI